MASPTSGMAQSEARVIRVDIDENGKLRYTEAKSKWHEEDRMFRSPSKRHKTEYFQWISDAGSIEVTFKDDHPFDDHPVRADAGQLTPAVRIRSDATAKHYKYDVVLIANDGQRYEDDPEIVVEEGQNVDGNNIVEEGQN